MTDKEALAWELECHADHPRSSEDLGAALAFERARADLHLRARIVAMEATLATLKRPPLHEVYRDNEGDVLIEGKGVAHERAAS